MRMESLLNQRLRWSPPDVVYTPIDVTSIRPRRSFNLDASSFLRGNGWASPGARVTGGLSPPMRGGGGGGGETPRWRNPRRTWVENLTTLGPTSPPDARRLRFSGQKRGCQGVSAPFAPDHARLLPGSPPYALRPPVHPLEGCPGRLGPGVPPDHLGRLPPTLSHGGLGGCSGAAHHPGQPNPPAVAGEGVTLKPRGLAGRLDPVGHLADREPEHPVSIPPGSPAGWRPGPEGRPG